MVGRLDQIQADQGGPRRKKRRVTLSQFQEPKRNVLSASKSIESPCVKLERKRLLTIGDRWRRRLGYVFDALGGAIGLDVIR